LLLVPHSFFDRMDLHLMGCGLLTVVRLQ